MADAANNESSVKEIDLDEDKNAYANANESPIYVKGLKEEYTDPSIDNGHPSKF